MCSTEDVQHDIGVALEVDLLLFFMLMISVALLSTSTDSDWRWWNTMGMYSPGCFVRAVTRRSSALLLLVAWVHRMSQEVSHHNMSSLLISRLYMFDFAISELASVAPCLIRHLQTFCHHYTSHLTPPSSFLLLRSFIHLHRSFSSSQHPVTIASATK